MQRCVVAAAAVPWLLPGHWRADDTLNLRARATGSVPSERNVRDRLFAFHDWCARHEDIPS